MEGIQLLGRYKLKDYKSLNVVISLHHSDIVVHMEWIDCLALKHDNVWHFVSVILIEITTLLKQHQQQQKENP